MPSGLMGFSGRGPSAQERTTSPRALPAMPSASVGRAVEGSRTGSTMRASRPAKLPKPIQIKPTLAQCWATWEEFEFGHKVSLTLLTSKGVSPRGDTRARLGRQQRSVPSPQRRSLVASGRECRVRPSRCRKPVRNGVQR